MNYYGLNNEQFKSARSAAVVDIDKKTGAIKNVYFRTAESGFKDPLPDMQHQLAWNKLEPTPEPAPVPEPKPTEKAVAEKTPEPEPPEEPEPLVSADFYVKKHPRAGTANRPYEYYQRKIRTSKGEIQLSTSGRLGVMADPYIDGIGNIPLAISQARKLKERGINVIVSLTYHEATKRAAQAVGLEHYRGHMSSKHDPRSIELFNQIAKYLKEGKSVHVHCKHGTHRAKTGLAGGLLAAGYASSVGEAFKKVGLRYGSFGKYWGYLTEVMKYARTQGIKIESPQELRSKYGVTGSNLRNYSKGYKTAIS